MMSRSESGASAKWLVFLALIFLAPVVYVASGDWQARLALRGDADDVKEAIVRSRPTQPISFEELGDIFVSAKQSPSVYELSQPEAGEQRIVVEFVTLEGGRLLSGERSYACYQYRISTLGEPSVNVSIVKPEHKGGRACAEIRSVPLGFGTPATSG